MFKLLFIPFFLFANSESEFTDILNENKVKREVVFKYDPFDVSKTELKTENVFEEEVVKKQYNLEAIFNNSVKINGQWYTKKIDNYSIEIHGESVFLINDKEKIVLLANF